MSDRTVHLYLCVFEWHRRNQKVGGRNLQSFQVGSCWGQSQKEACSRSPHSPRPPNPMKRESGQGSADYGPTKDTIPRMLFDVCLQISPDSLSLIEKKFAHLS